MLLQKAEAEAEQRRAAEELAEEMGVLESAAAELQQRRALLREEERALLAAREQLEGDQARLLDAAGEMARKEAALE